jgi:S1-C subfamily serine protease
LQGEAAQQVGRKQILPVLRAFIARHQRSFSALTGAMLALLAVFAYAVTNPAPPTLAQKDIDAAVRRSLKKIPHQSHAAVAYEAVKNSVVRVRSLGDECDKDKDAERGVGTGVVVNENGTILTNLHVVAGAHRIGIVFANGYESDAVVVGRKPEHDLAVIRAKSTPPNLRAATLRSTADLRLGDETVAVGFPFGIGPTPSVSAGVISGLHRNYRAPDGQHSLTNLIQFDATANPGNSGGPLLTTRGDVVGIVTAILSPGEVPGSVGIGFAVPIENAASAVVASPF